MSRARQAAEPDPFGRTGFDRPGCRSPVTGSRSFRRPATSGRSSTSRSCPSARCTVPIYETSSAEQVRFVLQDSGRRAGLRRDRRARRQDRAPRTTSCRAAQGAAHRRLRHHRRWTSWPRRASRSTRSELDDRVAGIKAADPATLIYTSGTTGRPKGCQLTHSNLVYEIRGAKACFPTLLDKGERLLVFLPLAHVLARAITIARVRQQGDARLHQRHQEPGADVRGVQADAGGVGAAGVREGLQHRRAERPQRRQGQDLRRSRPTPRSSTARRRTPAGRACCCGPSTRCSTGWSTASCGPRSAATAARAISGGAPLGARLGHFYRGVGLTIYEGYGLTETSAAITVNQIDDVKVGSVGKLLPGNSMRLADDGELLVARRRGVRTATGTTRRRPTRSSPTAGSTPAISARSTTTAS